MAAKLFPDFIQELPEGHVLVRLSDQGAGCWASFLAQNGQWVRGTVHEDLDWREILCEIVAEHPELVWFTQAEGDVFRDALNLEVSFAQGIPRSECPICPSCKGCGKYVGFLLVEECDPCQGTGLDLSQYDLYHVRIIKRQELL